MNIVKLEPLEQLSSIEGQDFYIKNLLECQSDYIKTINKYADKRNRLKEKDELKIENLVNEYFPKIKDIVTKFFYFVEIINNNCNNNNFEKPFYWDVEDEYEKDIDSFYNSIVYSLKLVKESKILHKITRMI